MGDYAHISDRIVSLYFDIGCIRIAENISYKKNLINSNASTRMEERDFVMFGQRDFTFEM